MRHEIDSRSTRRRAAGITCDSATRFTVLFGGAYSPDGNNSFSHTGAWNGVTRNWTRHHPLIHPTPRTTNPLTYDPLTRTVVLFGGVRTDLIPLNDTWTWNGLTWTEIAPTGSLPPARYSPIRDYDPVSKVILLFGGDTSESVLAGHLASSFAALDLRQNHVHGLRGRRLFGAPVTQLDRVDPVQ